VPKFSKEKTDEIIKSFMDDFDMASTAENEDRIDMIDDLRFAALDQWPEEVRRERKGRPMLTLDHIGQSVRKVLGGMRQNMPSIKVDPIDDGADKETADVLEDLTRQIEQSSNARNAYINAANFQVKCGYGVWRINTVENTDDIFVQDIVINPVKNPFTYYFDPDAIKPQKQDGRFMIVSETMSKQRFKNEFPKDIDGEPIDIPGNSIGGTGENRERWYADDSVRIGEYFVRSKKTKSVTQLSNGVVVDSDSITEEDIALYQQQGVTPVRERKVKADVIDWYKLTSFKILEHKVWPSKYFPGIPVYGEEDNIEGKTWHRGIVRAAKDPQRMYNYWNSAAAETIALQPKAPFLVTANQIKNYKQFWNQANTDNLPYLPYEPDGKAPPPQRLAPPTMQSGMLQQASISAQDIQQATGVFEAAQQPTKENRSGVAVEALQREADLGSSLFMDNLAGGIEHCGRVIIDLIPTYYDSQRVIRLRGEDDSVGFAEINKPILTPDGMKIQNDLTRGKYDVRVGVGPSYRTKRLEAASSMVELARVFPQILEVAGDLVAKNLDWPGADDIAERLKKLLPPGMAEMDEDDPAAQQIAENQAKQNELQEIQTRLALEGEQAKINNMDADTASKKATSVKNLTEAQQNDIENAINTVELAQREGDIQLKTEALAELVQLMGAQSPQIQQGPANAI